LNIPDLKIWRFNWAIRKFGRYGRFANLEDL